MSQTGVDFNWSQEMPVQKRQRSGSYSKKNFGKKNGGRAIMRLPRAISTRGTPDGYYEIPMRQLFRVYVNTSTGFWNTNQTSSGPIGSTGYNGLALYATLDNTYIALGNGSTSATITQSVPDFSSAANMFDLCKIADLKIDCWFTNQSRELGSGIDAYGAMEAFLAEDVNDAIPPNDIKNVLDKKRVLRAMPSDGKTFKMGIKPHIVIDGAGHDGAGTATTTSISSPSTYLRCDRPAVTHFGIKGWCATPSAATAYTAVLNILVTQTRRYKMNN